MAKTFDLDVAYVARLARLNLTDEETELFQKQLGDVQDVVQDSVQSGLSKTQEVLGKGTKQASKSLMQATDSVMDMRDSLQDQYASYIRKRQQARMLFRWGLLTGLVFALLFTPLPGSQVRQMVAQQWERFRGSMDM